MSSPAETIVVTRKMKIGVSFTPLTLTYERVEEKVPFDIEHIIVLSPFKHIVALAE